MSSQVISWELKNLKKIYEFIIDNFKINYVAYSSKGKIIALAGESKKNSRESFPVSEIGIKIFDACEPKVLFDLDRYEYITRSSENDNKYDKDYRIEYPFMKISPTGQYLVSFSNWTEKKHSCLFKVWNLKSGSLINVDFIPIINEEQRYLDIELDTRVEINHKDYLIICDNTNYSLKIYDLNTGKLIHILTGHADIINCIKIHPDPMSDLLVSASQDNTIKIWDLKIGNLVQTLLGHTAEVYHVQFSIDGKLLISEDESCNTKIWKLLQKDDRVNTQEIKLDQAWKIKSLIELGDLLCKSNNYNDAIDVYTTLLTIDSSNGEGYVQRSKAHLAVGNIQEAFQDLQKAKKLLKAEI